MAGLTELQIEYLSKISGSEVNRDIDLSKFSRWRIGGNADYLITPASIVHFEHILKYLSELDITPVIVGSTSNLLFSDEGLRCPLIKIGDSFSNFSPINDGKVIAEAGIWVPYFARKLMLNGLSGGEHLCGIPGTLGGLLAMNGGSLRKSISENVLSIDALRIDGRKVTLTRGECEFGYRKSIFQSSNMVIVSATFQFVPKEKEIIRRDMLQILRSRRLKFPNKEANCGSVFKSNPLFYKQFGPPGEVIESLGFKGKSIGGAKVPDKHANFIVNSGLATSDDVLTLINTISREVYDKTGHKLEAEVLYVASNGKVTSADNVV
ncbi:UDP-N-acetylmuramate dehydrogenase [Idiomarina loihiensis]|uniref:UDP-N-acetylmuramate dehydrogenase n=1 Tax=Idiomarina loihiensis TaxID=135577 RepID=UPI003850ED15